MSDSEKNKMQSSRHFSRNFDFTKYKDQIVNYRDKKVDHMNSHSNKRFDTESLALLKDRDLYNLA